MNKALELHDSRVCSYQVAGDLMEMVLDTAYIHVSENASGIDGGTGWSQVARVKLSDPVLSGQWPQLPLDIMDGVIIVDGEVYDNLLPLPFEFFFGEVKVCLKFTLDDSVEITSTKIEIELEGEATYIEKYGLPD